MQKVIAVIRAWHKRRLDRRALRKHPNYKLGWDWTVRQVEEGSDTAENIYTQFRRPADAFDLGVHESALKIVADEDHFIW